MLHRFFKPFVSRLCDTRLACSKAAGEWLYGKSEFTILPNAFNLSRFEFDPESRDTVRDSYEIGKRTIVLGNVARLNPEKNHAFLISVFEEYHSLHPDSMLLIAGGGPGMNRVKGLVESSSARDSIFLLGNVVDPSKLYSCMACFVFPSRYEGLGIALIEAQASGLECFVSECIPQEACVSDKFHVLQLDSGARAWADEIARTMEHVNPRNRHSGHDARLACFDIRSSYHILEEAYGVALAKRGRR